MVTGTHQGGHRRAAGRRAWHRDNIDAADNLRSRVWRAAGWVIAEARRAPVPEREEAFNTAVDGITKVAEELHERNVNRDRH